MFSTTDTIVAVATPRGRGALGIVRLSGSQAEAIARRLVARERAFEPRRATFARFRAMPAGPGSSSDHGVGDHVVVTFFPGPRSYTGEDLVEVTMHGSPVLLEGLLQSAMNAGARLAEPGEFSLRAFLHGKLDLVQAEAVADLVDAVTPLQARIAFDQLDGTLTTRIQAIEAELFDLMARLEASLDFPDEGYHFVEPGTVEREVAQLDAKVGALLGDARRGRLVREGAQVAIVGAPNVGKSSLFNALLNANRAIVSAVPGTTRDLLSERVDLLGLSVVLVDTAGVHEATDPVEQEGVSRARRAAEAAELLVVVLDRSRAIDAADRSVLQATSSRARVVVANKIDAPAAWAEETVDDEAVVPISVREGRGLDALARTIAERLGAAPDGRDTPAISNVRHIALLTRVRDVLARAAGALRASQVSISEEFLLTDLQEAASLLQEVSGRRAPDDLLRRIFERFCIGK